MLQPKQTKFRKMHKGRNRGLAQNGNTIAFGRFGLVASNRGRDKTAIFEFDVNESKEGKLIFEHDEVDVSGLMYSKKRKVLTGVNFTVSKGDKVFFDDSNNRIETDNKQITEKFERMYKWKQ